MGNNKKIAIIVWDIGSIGGIATQALDFKKIFDIKNIFSNIILLTDKKRPYKIASTEIIAKDQQFQLKGIELSVHFDNINKTLKYLNQYDIFIHTTACVHNDASLWQGVYALKKKHIVIISDVYWDKYYPYFDYAIPYISKIFATNRAVKNYLKEVKKIETEELIHPFFFEPNFKKQRRERTIIWANQWRGWKGIEWFLEQAGQLDGKVLLFGGGREWYNLKNKIPKNAEYLGFRKPEEVLNAYMNGAIAVDLTGQSEKYYGHYNRTTIEPMFWDCAVVANEKLIEPYSFIPQNVVCAVNKKNFVEKTNELLSNQFLWEKQILEARNWAMKHYDYDNFIKQIISNDD